MTKATAQAAVRHTSLISLVRLHPPEAAEGGGNKSYLKAPRFPQRGGTSGVFGAQWAAGAGKAGKATCPTEHR